MYFKIIRKLRVWLGLELNSAGQWPSRTGVPFHVVWNTTSSFLSSADVWFWSVSLKRLGSVPICASASDNRWHTQRSQGNKVRSLWAFSFEKAPLSSVPFLKRIGAVIWGSPPAARVRPLLRQRVDWDSGDHRWSLAFCWGLHSPELRFSSTISM